MTKRKKLKVLPHVGVLTYVGVSKVEKGKLGVFALVPIPVATNAFPSERGPSFYISEKKLMASNPSKRICKLYDRLGYLEGDRRLTYPDFGALPNSAHIAKNNKTPNLRYGPNDEFWTMRPIRIDEELTLDFD